MKHLAMALLCCGSLARAEGPPRIVVQPLAASIPLPGAANAALLGTLAVMAVDLPSTFEVDDALATLPSKTCSEDVPCLAGLARATKSQWALAVAFHQLEGRGELAAKIVSVEGTLARPVETLALPVVPSTEAAWAEAFRALLGGLQLEALGKTPPPVVVAPPVEPPAPAKPLPVVTPPRQVQQTAPATSARGPVAIVAGLVAIGVGGAAGALALTNLQEARLLDEAKRGGLIPGSAVDRAVALDERTVAATALGIGAGVAAAVAVGALLMKDAPVQVAPSVGTSGAGITLSGRLP